MAPFWCFYCEHISHISRLFSVSIVDFKHVFVCWGNLRSFARKSPKAVRFGKDCRPENSRNFPLFHCKEILMFNVDIKLVEEVAEMSFPLNLNVFNCGYVSIFYLGIANSSNCNRPVFVKEVVFYTAQKLKFLDFFSTLDFFYKQVVYKQLYSIL